MPSGTENHLGDTILRVEDLHKRYGKDEVLKGVSLELRRGETKVVIGPSGTGKSTLLRCINQLSVPDKGRVWLDDVEITHARTNINHVRAQIGFVFQDFNLFNHLTALQNVSLGLIRVKKMRRDAALERARKELARVGLEAKAGAYPAELSGGQKQRLAIGVALINNPELVFLDEPTTGLDPQARRNIWAIVSGLTASGKTVILTTHYMEEAEALSQMVCIMDHGKVIAQGSPRELTSKLSQETIVEFLAPDGASFSPALAERCTITRGEGGLVSVKTSDLVGTLGGLLDWSRSSGEPLAEMTVRQPNLEDVFLSLTGRRLRS